MTPTSWCIPVPSPTDEQRQALALSWMLYEAKVGAMVSAVGLTDIEARRSMWSTMAEHQHSLRNLTLPHRA
jgi:hypothetical protein